VGKEFQTADHVVQRAQKGYWLCVGVVGEPWFQKKERIDAKYDPGASEVRQFAFDGTPRTYLVCTPKGDVCNWVAQVQGTWQGKPIEGFSIRPNYDMDHPLFTPAGHHAGNYVVKDDVPDPYADDPEDIWLIQEALFKSTYELLP
jgi:hypothetical protein